MAEGKQEYNTQNLIPGDQRSQSEARELGKQGGIASGEARREKRKMREILREYLETRMVGDKTMIVEMCERYAEHIMDKSIGDMPTLFNQLEGMPKQDVAVSGGPLIVTHDDGVKQ